MRYKITININDQDIFTIEPEIQPTDAQRLATGMIEATMEQRSQPDDNALSLYMTITDPALFIQAQASAAVYHLQLVPTAEPNRYRIEPI